MTKRALLAVTAAAGALAGLPADAHAAACPSSVKAPQAIVIEVSTGIVACQRQADKERPVGSTT